jgi:hypothetical protein
MLATMFRPALNKVKHLGLWGMVGALAVKTASEPDSAE